MDEDSGSTSQVRVELSTRHEDVSIPQNPGPILVSTNFKRYALSTLVNTLLGSEKPTPFEFLINGAFLRTSLDDYLTTNGISSETVLSLEYIKAKLPPTHLASFPHDDWISSIDVLPSDDPSAQPRILSGCYDGLLRIWNTSSDLLTTSLSVASDSVSANGGHIPSVKAARFLGRDHIASSGRDRIVRIWKYADDGTNPPVITPQIEQYGHKDSIDAIAVHNKSNRILSASQDCQVGFWATKKSEAPEAPTSLLPSAASNSAKKRKVGATGSVTRRGPLALMQSHKEMVRDVIFAPNDFTVGYSVSIDKSLKTWDLPTSTCIDTRTTTSPLHSITALPSLNLLAAGSFQRIVLIDPRANATTVTAMTLRGHTNVVSTLASDPHSTYGLLSGSFDSTCRIWDVRSSKSDTEGRVGECIYTIERESTKGQGRKAAGDTPKIFGVSWTKDVGIISAGEDKMLQINQGKTVTEDGIR